MPGGRRGAAHGGINKNCRATGTKATCVDVAMQDPSSKRATLVVAPSFCAHITPVGSSLSTNKETVPSHTT